MILGYSFILLAALCWGASGIIGKYWGTVGVADALLLSQARVTFAWLVLFIGLVLFGRRHLRISFRELLRFALLGLIGVAGANFMLYFAINRMNVAVADLIQFTAPLLVALYLSARGIERMDLPKVLALALSLIGSGLALGVVNGSFNLPAIAVASAFASALCYGFLIVFGKGLTRDYSMWTFLHYALLTATLFWLCITPPMEFVQHLKEPAELARLFGFGMLSILLPYVFFFSGLKRVPASRAGIVSTFEPVVMAVGSWLVLGDPLSRWQVVGVALVLAAIAVVEMTSKAMFGDESDPGKEQEEMNHRDIEAQRA
ncbi:MAG: DMT family transporter [Candidatus Sumerlaeaceae bacterium]